MKQAELSSIDQGSGKWREGDMVTAHAMALLRAAAPRSVITYRSTLKKTGRLGWTRGAERRGCVGGPPLLFNSAQTVGLWNALLAPTPIMRHSSVTSSPTIVCSVP